MNQDDNTLVTDNVRGDTLVLVVRVRSVREAEVSHALRDQLISAADCRGLSNVVIDFGQVEFMGSIGFLALLSLVRHVPDGRFAICGLNERLHEMFVACRLTSNDRRDRAVFATAETVEEAVQALKNSNRPAPVKKSTAESRQCPT